LRVFEFAFALARYPCYHVSMIRSFRDAATEDVFNGLESKAARRGLPSRLRRVTGRKLDALDQAEVLDDLRIPPGNRLEALRGDREGEHSIRINDQYRICFRWTEAGPEEVEVVDYH
jgi:toxin HigB-1